MLKKAIMLLVLGLPFAASYTKAVADPDIPLCFPCDEDKKDGGVRK